MKIKEVIEKLQDNNFEVYYVKTKEEVLPIVALLTKDDVTFSHGGSLTLEQCGIIDFLKTKGLNYYDRARARVEGGEEAYVNMLAKAMHADVFLTSVNAITKDGELYLVDGNGNRAAAVVYGPKKLVIVVSTNKIVASKEEARKRVFEIAAPLNAKRLNRSKECAKEDSKDCPKDKRLCNIEVFINHTVFTDRIKIILVEEELGF